MTETVTNPTRSISRWCHEAGLSRSYLYGLPPEQRPEMLKITARKTYVLESPEQWLTRLAALQATSP